jgi:hypothetical protein
VTAPYAIESSWHDAPANVHAALAQALPTLAARLGRQSLSSCVAVVLVDDVGLLNASLVARSELPPDGPELPRVHGELSVLIASSPTVVWIVQARRDGSDLVISEGS